MLRRLLRLPRLFSWRGCAMSLEGADSALSERYQKLVEESGAHLSPEDARHTFLVIHPKIRWGENSASKTTSAELQLAEAIRLLAEAIRLVKTLPGFSVANSVIVGTDYNTKKKRIWGAGRLDALVEVKNRHHISAVMVNVDMLSPLQQSELHNVFGCPIYDRYNIVLLIFKHYARTKEAKLQIELAELPYIRHRMKYLDYHEENPSVLNVKLGVVKSNTGADKYELLRLHEQSLRKKLRTAVDSKSEDLEKRAPRGTVLKPTLVSVIGYTNAGKTTLIKKLTGSSSLHGEDRLFATLDTSLHSAILPSRRRVTFADTIGFISQLPVQLFASFSATLSHVVHSNVLVHIHDVSHPDVLAQRENHS
uniref:Hflx-type G domain-containing protein n=2 Tax=Steinernema glaseri TaxID=37863 RepID=A0A1I7YRZ3_9BILA